MAEIIVTVGLEVAKCLVPSTRSEISHMRKYKRNFQNLKAEVEKLMGISTSIQHKVDESNGEEIEENVQRCLERENNIINEEVVKFIEDEETASKKRCFKGLCPNLKARYQLIKESVRQLEAVVKHREAVSFDTISYLTSPKDPRLSNRNYMAFESRESIWNDVLRAISNPDFNIIGIYGMGGVGKITLAKEVANQAERNKLRPRTIWGLSEHIKQEMERTERMLYESAVKGSVNTLLNLLNQDPLILDNQVTVYSLSESPLHVAAALGHVDFVKEILRRKPQLAEELDWQRSSALHKASHKGYADIVHALLQVNPDMCFACDADGRNPLHLAVMGGWIDVLEELVRARPLAVSTTTIWGETILHLCLKHNQLEALKFLLEKMDDLVQELLNAKNDFGMTILHLAVADKQLAVIEFLTTRQALKINALSTNCFTALDILDQSKRDVKDSEIWELLRRAGAIRAEDILLSANELNITEGNSNSLASHDTNQKQQLQGKGLENVPKTEDGFEEKRNALMVVASLIATMAFQACLAPPHNPRQDNSSQDDRFRTAFMPSPKSKNSYPYAHFLAYNTTGFLASLSIILLLISGIPLKRNIFMWILMVIMWVAITAMAMTYMVSIDFLADSNRLDDRYSATSSIVIITWIGVGVILILGHSTRLTVKMVKYIKKSFRETKEHSESR